MTSKTRSQRSSTQFNLAMHDELLSPPPHADFRERRNLRILGVSLSAATLVAFVVASLPFLGTQVPSTQGWYSSLWSNRAKLYTDSYWSLPPAGILFEGWPRQFHPSFLIVDIVHLLYWVLFLGLVFALCRRFAGESSSFISTLIVGSVAFAQPGNIVSGYFETHYLLGLSAIFLASSTRCSKTPLYSLAFCLAILSWGTKQTGVFSVLLVLFAFLNSEHTRNQRVGQQTNWVPSVRSLSRAIRAFLLGAMFAFPFMLAGAGGVRQLWASKFTFFGSGGKAPSIQGLLPMFLNGAGNSTVILLLSLIFVAVVGTTSRYASATPAAAFLVLFLFASAVRPFSLLGRIIAVALILVVLFDYLADSVSPSKRRKRMFLSVLGVAVFPIYLTYEFSKWVFRGVNASVSRGGLIGPYWNDASVSSTESLTALFILIGCFAFRPINRAAQSSFMISASESHHGSVEQVDGPSQARSLLIPLLFPILLAIFGSSFLGGFTLETIVPITAVGLAVILESLTERQRHSSEGSVQVARVFAHGILSVLILLAGTSWVRQFELPYQWFGVNGASLTERLGADGSYISPSGESYFDRSNRFLLHTELNAIARDDRVLVGPRNVGLTVGSAKETVFQNCIVLWWDVCPEQEARKDLELLKSGAFKYALWTFEGNDVIASNEFIWRDGRSSAVGQMNTFLDDVLTTSPERALFSMTEDYASGRSTVLIDLKGISTA